MDNAIDQTIVRHEVNEIQFGFYNEQEIRELSVKQITSPIVFDSLGNPVLSGLYDPAMGPIDFKQNCPTCHLTQKDCPGHMGHIELPVPVYNPVLFMTMYGILKRKCLSCHRFRLNSFRTREFYVKVLLLDSGHYDEAMTLSEKLLARNGDFDETNLQISQRQTKVLDELEMLASSNSQSENQNPYLVEAERIKTIGEFLGSMVSAKCSNCEAYSPALRQDAHAKFFLKPLGTRASRINAKHSRQIKSAMESNVSEHALDYQDGSDPEDEDDSSEISRFLPVLEVQSQMENLWKSERLVTELFWGKAATHIREKADGWKLFFMQVIPVAPSRFRPPVIMQEKQFEHSQNSYLTKILQACENIVEEAPSIEGQEDGPLDLSKKIQYWNQLQENVNCLMDNSTAKRPQDMPQGIRQVIEKKEGLFRKHMMGKRVNYSARSVISPDPYIGTSEIGVPLRFAKKLTYPQAVTPWNVDNMRTLVINGPDNHPGANFVENENGFLIDLSKRNYQQRVAISKTLLTRSASACGSGKDKVKRVWRHLKSGDAVLMNRQPTLHKPSMMAHKTRVLTNPELQTIRMHYVNCNTFNADFDGDEMNMHFPQNELARAEAYHIAANDNQYIVPTDGTPLRGLIQDHVDSGVKLTKRDTFLDRDMVMQLLFNAWTCMDHLGSARAHIDMISPAILKPKMLWTGKQVISSILLQLTHGLPLLNLDSKTRVKENAFGKENAEHIVVFRSGELLQGVLDKSQFGASENGLVHSVYEIYGPRMAADILTALGRLFTTYLQFSGHTCALEDLTLNKDAEIVRAQLVKNSRQSGRSAYAKFAGVSDTSKDVELNDEKLLEIRKNMQKLMAVDRQLGADLNSQGLDSHMMTCVHQSNSEIIKACLPKGQRKSFPSNCFSLMVLTGAKGSMVNHSQISCGLGQQALEGRRVPTLVSGRSLPSFEPYDPSPRAGGYITDRFLTGLRPQEYYHHCMAGREGLVDTAVKTSRSGYLQRCLVKHLEDLSVAYDHTVRNTDGSVIQFLYGEDGVDATEGSLLSGGQSQMTFLAMNHNAFSHKFSIHGKFFDNTGLDMLTAATYHRKLSKAKRAMKSKKFKVGQLVEARSLKDTAGRFERGNVESGWHLAEIVNVNSGDSSAKSYDIVYKDNDVKAFNVPQLAEVRGGLTKSRSIRSISGTVECIRKPTLDPIMHAVSLDRHVGVISERLQAQLAEYSNSNPDRALASSKKKMDDYTNCADKVSPAAFELLLWVKYLRSLCAPGENVGTIAAQSIGEPSTQMTLNTFHLAGHGAANVTLGIPRLREIIMTASTNMKTPAMTVPFKDSVDHKMMQSVERELNRISLKDLVRNERGVAVKETLKVGIDQLTWVREYRIKISFYEWTQISENFGLSLKEIFECVSSKFVPKLLASIRNELKKSGTPVGTAESSTSVGGSAVDSVIRQRKNSTGEDDEEQGTLKFGNQKEISGYGELDDDEIDLIRAENESASEDNRKMFDDSSSDHDGINSSTSIQETSRLEVIGGDRFEYFVDCFQDPNKGEAEIVLNFPVSRKQLLLVPIIQASLCKVFVRECRGITRCFNIKQRLDPNGFEVACLQTEGLNFSKVWSLQDTLDINHLQTNDIYQMLQNYGVEAARASISKQINQVFGVYGINVDPRHLSLLSDYMTYGGDYTPLNRIGMKSKGSPFQQITFETSMTFLSTAATFGLRDKMESPSARLVVGQPTKVGTGKFTLLQPVTM